MCGRFVFYEFQNEIKEDLYLSNSLIPKNPNFNISPGLNILTLKKEKISYKLYKNKWGILKRLENEKIRKFINIRFETLSKNKSLKNILKNNICFIPTNGFFEWKLENNIKQPYFISLKNNKTFFMAGISQLVRDKNNNIDRNCAIITCKANSNFKFLHDRMPIIITGKQLKNWMENEVEFCGENGQLNNHQENNILYWEVNTKVNKPSYNFPDCISPL